MRLRGRLVLAGVVEKITDERKSACWYEWGGGNP